MEQEINLGKFCSIVPKYVVADPRPDDTVEIIGTRVTSLSTTKTCATRLMNYLLIKLMCFKKFIHHFGTNQSLAANCKDEKIIQKFSPVRRQEKEDWLLQVGTGGRSILIVLDRSRFDCE